MSESITVIANGQPYQLAPQTTLPDFLQELGQQLRRVVIEHNGHALHAREAEAIRLNEGDRLEIVRIVAGG